jgi:homoserine dehydrogenase
MLPVEVLKFGSSVLVGPGDLPLAVDEVYRRLRDGYRVLAVVSAFAGETDRLLLRAAEALGADAAPEATAAFVATGELQSAALLTGALLRAGITARAVDPREIALAVEGGSLEADLVSVDVSILQLLWTNHVVLVLPGFFGIDPQGRVALLGRGGSDLSALYLARALRARCHLVKDVPGVYDRDPAIDLRARRYAVIRRHEASEVAGPLIQPKALAFAEAHKTPFSVSRANGALATEVADVPASIWAGHVARPQPLRVALLGLGTVGLGVCERLLALSDLFELKTVVVRRPERHLASGVPAHLVTDNTDAALHADIDLVIECMSGVEPAGSVIEAALAFGKTVVSANNAAVAEYWPELALFTREPDRRLWLSATVGGAVPMLETLAGLTVPVRELRGVINGTCNSVLDRLVAGESFEAAVRAAQRDGFAETDPDRDLSGLDSADKLTLLAEAAFRLYVRPGHIPTRGVEGPFATDESHVWRLLARASRPNGALTLSVGPERVPRKSFLGEATGAENRLEIVLEGGSTLRLVGQGAGRWPTTTAVIGDVHEIARRRLTMGIQ